jgi:eukaryotic-like serine/threonine-protein kinase
MAGTAPWMAPEQIDSSLGSISPQTDVYGLGALLYTLLTGKPPFPGKRTPDVLARIVSAEIPIAPSAYRFDIPGLVERLCLQCLEKSPGNRPQSMADVVLALSPNGSPNGRYSSSC